LKCWLSKFEGSKTRLSPRWEGPIILLDPTNVSFSSDRLNTQLKIVFSNRLEKDGAFVPALNRLMEGYGLPDVEEMQTIVIGNSRMATIGFGRR
jgi:hypothetical protein